MQVTFLYDADEHPADVIARFARTIKAEIIRQAEEKEVRAGYKRTQVEARQLRAEAAEARRIADFIGKIKGEERQYD